MVSAVCAAVSDAFAAVSESFAAFAASSAFLTDALIAVREFVTVVAASFASFKVFLEVSEKP